MVSGRFGHNPSASGTTGGSEAPGEESVPESRTDPSDSGEPFRVGTGVDCCRTFLDEPTDTRLVYTERRELVLVEADQNDRRSALKDALPGKQHRKNIRGRAGNMPEKES
jgi:hypothetical protein